MPKAARGDGDLSAPSYGRGVLVSNLATPSHGRKALAICLHPPGKISSLRPDAGERGPDSGTEDALRPDAGERCPNAGKGSSLRSHLSVPG
jgi:hypothetical protein